MIRSSSISSLQRSPTNETTPKGQRVYTAYGMNRSGTGNPIVGFAGARKLGNTGLYYMRNRVYDPTLGRFLSRDPAGMGPNRRNVYAYAEGRPILARDPSGLVIQIMERKSGDRELYLDLFRQLFPGTRFVVDGSGTLSFTPSQPITPDDIQASTSLSWLNAMVISPKNLILIAAHSGSDPSASAENARAHGLKSVTGGEVSDPISEMGGGEFSEGYLVLDFSDASSNKKVRFAHEFFGHGLPWIWAWDRPNDDVNEASKRMVPPDVDLPLAPYYEIVADELGQRIVSQCGDTNWYNRFRKRP
jgi:RHS repeat-associated protein